MNNAYDNNDDEEFAKYTKKQNNSEGIGNYS